MELYNLDLERAILNSILQDNTIYNEVNHILNSDDFYLPFHQEVFKAIETILKEKDFFDEYFLQEELTKREKFNEELFFEILSITPLANELAIEYAKNVKELSLKRKLHFLFKKASIETENKNTLELIEEVKKELEDLEKNNTNTFKISTYSMGKAKNKKIEFILKDFLPIPKRAITLLSAKGGSGKSWLVIQLALRYVNENPNSKVFAWLAEDSEPTIIKRMEKILNKILINDKKIKFYNINHQAYDNFGYLENETKPFKFIEYNHKNKTINPLFYKLKHDLKDFDFIILDPLIAFFDGDENNNSQAREFMDLLAEWASKENKAILVVHHNNKSIVGGIRGASAFVDAARLHYELLTKDNEDELPAGYRKIKIQKDNWFAQGFLEKKEIEVQVFSEELFNEDNKKNEVQTSNKPKSKDNEKKTNSYNEVLSKNGIKVKNVFS